MNRVLTQNESKDATDIEAGERSFSNLKLTKNTSGRLCTRKTGGANNYINRTMHIDLINKFLNFQS